MSEEKIPQIWPRIGIYSPHYYGRIKNAGKSEILYPFMIPMRFPGYLPGITSIFIFFSLIFSTKIGVIMRRLITRH